jgi:hypothetical protein
MRKNYVRMVGHRLNRTSRNAYGEHRSHCQCGWFSAWQGTEFSAKARHRDHKLEVSEVDAA